MNSQPCIYCLSAFLQQLIQKLTTAKRACKSHWEIKTIHFNTFICATKAWKATVNTFQINENVKSLIICCIRPIHYLVPLQKIKKKQTKYLAFHRNVTCSQFQPVLLYKPAAAAESFITWQMIDVLCSHL